VPVYEMEQYYNRPGTDIDWIEYWQDHFEWGFFYHLYIYNL